MKAKYLIRIAAIAGLGIMFGCATPPPPVAELKVNDQAPDFTGTATGGKTVSLSALKGKWVVMSVVLRADKAKCVQQLVSLRNGYPDLKKMGAEVLALSSVDPLARLEAVKAQNSLPFDLISDTNKKIARSYGLMLGSGSYPKRTAFIIGPDGKIAAILEDLKVERHDAELKEALAAAQKKAPAPAPVPAKK